MNNKHITITEEFFDDNFKLIKNHIVGDDEASFSGQMFETYGEELEFVIEMEKENRVLTIIEGDGEEYNQDDELISTITFTTGMHHVNRLGYLVLEKPYTYNFDVNID